MQRWQKGIVCGLIAVLAGCSQNNAPSAPASPTTISTGGYGGYGEYDTDPNMIQFLDTAPTQDAPAEDFATVPLTTADGKTVTLKELANGKSLVAVFTRGYAGSICPYCSTQTSRLIANYPEFQKRDAEVVVIYPLEKPEDSSKLGDFLTRVNQLNMAPTNQTPPFPLLVDIGLKAVDILGIRRDLSKPATYIIDGSGAVRFAYVGKSLADRPSVKALLEQLDTLKTAPAGG